MDFYFTPKRGPPPFDYITPPIFYSPGPERPIFIPMQPMEEPFYPRFPLHRFEHFSFDGGLESEFFQTPLKKKDMEIGINNKRRVDLGVEEEL